MGIELVIMFAHIFARDVLYEQRPLRQVQIQQRVYIEDKQANTEKILQAIEKIK